LLFRPTSAESKRNQILFIGDFSHDQKGLIYLRKAIEAIPAVTLRIVGKGDQFHASRTSYAGELTATQLVKEIQLSSVLVLPTVNKSESFGMVLIEAMACGVPVIASNIGGVPAVVEHNKSGLLVPPADVMSLTAAINQIINNKHLSKVLAENGLKQVRKSYAWSTKTAQFIGLCKTVELPSIVQITPYYPPHLGGMENVVQELSANLASQGFPTRVVTSDIGKSSSLYCDNEIFVDRLGGNEIAGLPILWKLFPRLLFMKNVDVFHVHIAQAGVPEVTLFTAWLRKKAIVMHFHLDVEPSGRFGFLFVMYKKILLGATLRHTNKLIAFSREQSEFLQTRYKVSSGRIDIVPNGISALFFSQNNKRENDLNPDTLQLLYVGRLATQKRVDRLVDAMPMVKPKTHLTIVGDGTQRIKLEERAKKLELDNVTFVGRMPLDAVKKYHLVSDVFVLPSDREGMPLVLLEAMASGLPVIGSNVVGIRELVDNVGVLVDKPSPQTFAAALNKMLIDQKLLADMSERSRNAASKLRWPAVTKQVGEIYKGLLS
jgi:glycosyltransferase involved in cell wall biosynthesis